MKILILSCNTGEGHNSAGKGIMDAAQAAGHEVIMQDMMLLSGERTSKIVGGAYVTIVKYVPWFFHTLYRIGSCISSHKRKSPVYYANALLAKKLERYLKKQNIDVVITPHLYPAETLTCLKKKGRLTVPALAVATDYTCIPFWEETRCDAYIAPHADLLEGYRSRGMTDASIYPYGIPVRSDFLKSLGMKRAREICGVPKDVHCYLVMSGSMGFGKIQLFVAQLLLKCDKNEWVIVICGNNHKLERILRREFGWKNNVKIIGYTKHVAEYMDVCDVIFTKPGGLTSTEAAVKQIPIVHTKPIPGCESANVDFFTMHGLSVSATRIKEQIRLGQELVRDEEKRRQMQQAQKTQIHGDCAERIIKLMEQMGKRENR